MEVQHNNTSPSALFITYLKICNIIHISYIEETIG